MRAIAILLIVCLLVSCGKSVVAPAKRADSAPKPAEKPTAAGISLADVFDSGQYRCTVETPEGTFTLKTRDGKFRYEGQSSQGPITMIVEMGTAQTTLYTYLPQQDKWFKLTLDNADAVPGATVFTKENAAQYPKHSCSKASNPESEFAVPTDKIVEQRDILAGLGQT